MLNYKLKGVNDVSCTAKSSFNFGAEVGRETSFEVLGMMFINRIGCLDKWVCQFNKKCYKLELKSQNSERFLNWFNLVKQLKTEVAAIQIEEYYNGFSLTVESFQNYIALGLKYPNYEIFLQHGSTKVIEVYDNQRCYVAKILSGDVEIELQFKSIDSLKNKFKDLMTN